MKKYKGQLKNFPEEIVEHMLCRQEEQGNKRNVHIFEDDRSAGKTFNGFDWDRTSEGYKFWRDVLTDESFSTFFDKYPKQKKITGYVFKTYEFRKAAEAIFGFAVLVKLKSTNPIVRKLKELNVLDIWCTPIYKEESEIVNIGKFKLTIKDKKVFHKNEEITKFVKNIVKTCKTFSVPSNNGDRTVVIKEVVFSKTGCEDSETTLSQWEAVYNKIK